MLTHPSGLFSGDYISALRESCPFKFLHALQSHKLLFSVIFGAPGGLPRISSFYSETNTSIMRVLCDQCMQHSF